MATLRSLLGTITTDSVKGLGAPDTATKLPPYPSKGYVVQYISNTCGSTCDGRTTNYGYSDYPDWKIPTGVNDVIFEIWGAGGGGGNGCCCTRGIPGGAGAYAYKRLTGTQVVAGCSYSIEIGIGGGGYTGPACGLQGGKTFITGYNLSNFCAEGGAPGCSCCFLCCCTFHTCVSGSNCAGGYCALYYGADNGAVGLPGAGYMWCYDNHCWNKQLIPYPGGLVNGKGGWLPGTQCADTGCGYCLLHWAGAQLQWGGSYSDHNYIPGLGGPSGWTCGGGCCYGVYGTAGLVRISYKYA